MLVAKVYNLTEFSFCNRQLMPVVSETGHVFSNLKELENLVKTKLDWYGSRWMTEHDIYIYELNEDDTESMPLRDWLKKRRSLK